MYQWYGSKCTHSLNSFDWYFSTFENSRVVEVSILSNGKITHKRMQWSTSTAREAKMSMIILSGNPYCKVKKYYLYHRSYVSGEWFDTHPFEPQRQFKSNHQEA